MNTFQGADDAQVLCLLTKISFLELIPGFRRFPGFPESYPTTRPGDLPSTHAGGQDDVSSKQTFSIWVTRITVSKPPLPLGDGDQGDQAQ